MAAEYIGDSVYVEEDSGMIKLTTNNGYPDDPRNIIYLEENVFYALVVWIKRKAENKEISDLFRRCMNI
jgi:hypothetical protein